MLFLNKEKKAIQKSILLPPELARKFAGICSAP